MAEQQHSWESTGRGTHRCRRCGVQYRDDQRERAPACVACVCGHGHAEHGPVWCRALACECRQYRPAEAAS